MQVISREYETAKPREASEPREKERERVIAPGIIEAARMYAAADRSNPFAFQTALAHIQSGLCKKRLINIPGTPAIPICCMKQRKRMKFATWTMATGGLKNTRCPRSRMWRGHDYFACYERGWRKRFWLSALLPNTKIRLVEWRLSLNKSHTEDE